MIVLPETLTDSGQETLLLKTILNILLFWFTVITNIDFSLQGGFFMCLSSKPMNLFLMIFKIFDKFGLFLCQDQKLSCILTFKPGLLELNEGDIVSIRTLKDNVRVRIQKTRKSYFKAVLLRPKKTERKKKA